MTDVNDCIMEDMSMEIQTLLTAYKADIVLHFGENMCSVVSTHKGRNLCFNSGYREILYAIRECFPIGDTTFNSCAWGHALLIPMDSVPSIPPFADLITHYRTEFHKRLVAVEEKLPDIPGALRESRTALQENPEFDFGEHMTLRTEYEEARKNRRQRELRN
jgi:hypothetical protein